MPKVAISNDAYLYGHLTPPHPIKDSATISWMWEEPLCHHSMEAVVFLNAEVMSTNNRLLLYPDNRLRGPVQMFQMILLVNLCSIVVCIRWCVAYQLQKHKVVIVQSHFFVGLLIDGKFYNNMGSSWNWHCQSMVRRWWNVAEPCSAHDASKMNQKCDGVH